MVECQAKGVDDCIKLNEGNFGACKIISRI